MATVLDLLGPDGPLARSMPDYEHREGQLAMATAVQEALDLDHVLLCEAGTGTGKTLAYLVPAILSDRKIVVSTATKALQDQIVHQDIPSIELHLGLQPEVAVAKGLSNYLCLRRFGAFRESPNVIGSRHERSIARIEAWLETTETGDVAELAWLPEGDPTWREVCSSAETRRGAKCPYYRDCFVTRMRRRCEAARIVIANHHLVFADLALRQGSEDRGGALPPYEAIVFDEAHQIEDTASEFFGVRVSTTRIEVLARDADRVFRAAGLRRLALGLQRWRHPDRLRSPASKGPVRQPGRRTTPKRRHRQATPEPRDLVRPRCSRATTGSTLPSMPCRASPTSTRTKTTCRRSDNGRSICVKTCHAWWTASPARSLGWRHGLARPPLAPTPIEVASTLKRLVFERVSTSILTSATLTTSSGFAFLRQRVGANGDTITIRELQVPSPFDFSRRALLYTPLDLPEPNDRSFAEKVAERTAELVHITHGGALVLCTSNRAMSIIYDALLESVPQLVMMQGEAPKTTLIERFRSSGRRGSGRYDELLGRSGHRGTCTEVGHHRQNPLLPYRPIQW